MDSGDLPDHIRDYRLNTQFLQDRTVVHIRNDSNAPPSAPKIHESWKRDKSPIGRGGQGRVFKQTCNGGQRCGDVRAVKTIPLHHGNVRRRYLGELRTIVKFSHDRYSQYFVKMLGWYESKEHLYIAMEFFPLGDLWSYLQKQSLHEDEARRITFQILQALAAMHHEGYAHRDIKPQNVLIQQHPNAKDDGSWWVKLTDFGISKKVQAATQGSSIVIGTVEYMAPELFMVVQNQRINYRAADMWALGVMTFFIITRRSMFQSQRDIFQFEGNPDQFFPYTKLQEHQVSRTSQAFIHALMKPKPEERPDSDSASRLAWIKCEVPLELTFQDTRSESSASSSYSRRSSKDEERGTDTQPSRVTGPQTALNRAISIKASSNFVKSSVLPTPELPENNISESQTTISHQVSNSESANGRNGSLASDDNTTAQNLSSNNEELFSRDTLLLSAIYHGNIAMVRLLLSRGAPLEIRTDSDHTPLLVASACGHETLVELLLKEGARVDEKTNFGHTSLILASFYGYKGIASLLIDHGAEVETREEHSRTPISLAAKKGHLDVVRVLAESGAQLEPRDRFYFTPLINACYQGHTAVARLLLEKGAQIEATAEHCTSIFFASIQGHHRVVRLLIHYGAQFEAVGKNNSTPLSVASRHGHELTTKVLLSKGAMLETKNKYSNTPLILASYHGHESVAKLLLEEGARLEVTNKHGYTPLLQASRQGHVAVVRLLIEKGANLEAKSGLGKTPLSVAAESEHQAVVELLVREGAKKGTGYYLRRLSSLFREG